MPEAERFESGYDCNPGREISGIVVSMGLSLDPDDGEVLEELLEQADKTMYEEKRLRKHLVPPASPSKLDIHVA